MQENTKYWVRNAILAFFTFTMIGIILDTFYILNPGFTAIHMRLGRIRNAQRISGIHLKAPMIDSIILMPNSIQRQHIETNALSKDLQAISIGIDVNYRYISEVELYKATLGQVEQIILIPFCHESIKAVISLYTAEDLIHNRHEAKDRIYNDLKARLKPHYIEFIEVNFSHADFSHAFIQSVEDKQIAHQQSMMAKNLTEKIRENAIQKKLTADADAYEQQVKKQSITKELVELKAIEKWDGRLPGFMGGSLPFINLKGI